MFVVMIILLCGCFCVMGMGVWQIFLCRYEERVLFVVCYAVWEYILVPSYGVGILP